MAEHDQRFDDFTQWANKASSWLTRHPEYREGDAMPFRAICFDAKGRLCQHGGDFKRAHEEGTFPVYWLWPDQIGALVMKPDLSKLSKEERIELFLDFCTECGSDNPGCQCWNDD